MCYWLSPVLTQEVYTHLMRHRYESGKQLMNSYIETQLAPRCAEPAAGETVVEM